MWALKRKLFVFTILLLIFVAIGFYVYKAFFMHTPTCFDGLHNGTEEGVDCGGLCTEVCKLKATNVNVLWAKTFEVSDGVANIAALVENPNYDYNMSATYLIKTFDEQGIRIHDFAQRINLAPGEKRLIFIPSVETGKVTIKKTFLDFEEIESLTLGAPIDSPLLVTSKIINKDEIQTRLTVGVKNTGLEPQRDIEVVAVLSNDNGDVINVAKTFVEYLNKREEKKVELTWQKTFDAENMRVDVYLRKI